MEREGTIRGKVKEVKGKGAKDFKGLDVLSARRSIPGSILWDSNLQSTFKGGSAINCFCPPLIGGGCVSAQVLCLCKTH